MSKPKWTPGPWHPRWFEKNKRCKTGEWYWTAPDTRFPGHNISVHIRGKNGESAANAHLIAAAPDLYEALQALWSEIQKYPNIGHEGSNLLEVMSDAKSALAKARGESA